MYDRTMILLVQPQEPGQEDDKLASASDKVEYERRLQEVLLLRKALESLGFQAPGRQTRDHSFEVDLSGCNWDTKALVESLYISRVNIDLLSGKVKEMAELKAKAIAKLTPEEQLVLGLLYRNFNEKTVYPDAYRE